MICSFSAVPASIDRGMGVPGFAGRVAVVMAGNIGGNCVEFDLLAPLASQKSQVMIRNVRLRSTKSDGHQSSAINSALKSCATL